jgi:hypothetical protein
MRQLRTSSFNIEHAAFELQASARTVRNDLDILVEKGWISSSGTTKGREYNLSETGKERLSR